MKERGGGAKSRKGLGQAEAAASVMRGAGEVDLSGLVTKEALRAEIAEMGAEMTMGFLEIEASLAESLGRRAWG